ncbi:MAG: hypothetical protein KGL39_12970 [Patescibacteria group bacterium]|nr:hypothetical protein [Patescibacteria group bacterium]
MVGSYIKNLFRVYTAEYNAAGRWSDADVYTLISEAQMWLALKMLWPILHAVAANPNGTQNGTQEYTLPDNFIQIKRVYVAGQAAVPTDIPTLEGDQIEYYDQSYPATYTPQWNSNASAAYPVSNTMQGYPQGVSPYYVGARPQWYMNGGNIGFVPVPAGQYQIDLWGVGVPNALTSDTSPCDFPQVCARALAWRAVGDAMFSDSQQERMQTAYLNAEAALADAREWKADFSPNKPRGWRPIQYRHFYRRDSVLGASQGNYD